MESYGTAIDLSSAVSKDEVDVILKSDGCGEDVVAYKSCEIRVRVCIEVLTVYGKSDIDETEFFHTLDVEVDLIALRSVLV